MRLSAGALLHFSPANATLRDHFKRARRMQTFRAIAGRLRAPLLRRWDTAG